MHSGGFLGSDATRWDAATAEGDWDCLDPGSAAILPFGGVNTSAGFDVSAGDAL